jgi:hypothetical protein
MRVTKSASCLFIPIFGATAQIASHFCQTTPFQLHCNLICAQPFRGNKLEKYLHAGEVALRIFFRPSLSHNKHADGSRVIRVIHQVFALRVQTPEVNTFLRPAHSYTH